MQNDQSAYFKFTGPARVEKAINSLVGIIEGVDVDNAINAREIDFLHAWIREHENIRHKHPYNEFISVVEWALSDGVLTADEKADILWLADKLIEKNYFAFATNELQRLHALLGGIAADGVISEAELRGLAAWLDAHENLKTLWPYDEVVSLVTTIFQDGKIDADEHRMLMQFFSGFVAIYDDKVIANPVIEDRGLLSGLCALTPDISFENSIFCFTGESQKLSRNDFEIAVERNGGKAVRSVSKKVMYLVVGGEGNPCWAYACYGRKVERAVELRKEGVPIVIVHENDFHDALADLA